jgi:glycogen debranching enzyme
VNGGARSADGVAHGASNEACVGSISEMFDAEDPYVPRGCVAQAWSVAEVLRCLDKTGAASDPSPYLNCTTRSTSAQ